MKKLILLISAIIFLILKAGATPVILEVKAKIIMVDGKQVQVATIEQANGTWGYSAKSGDKFDVIVKNDLPESTVVHWHGLILPNSQDGVAGLTQKDPIAPGSSMHYQFPLVQSGTYWMHSHYGLQLQSGVLAPLIIDTPEDSNYQQVVVMFQDFSFKSPESIFASLNNSTVSHGHTMHTESDNSLNEVRAMSKTATALESMPADDMDSMEGMEHGAMDLNDVKYDAYLTNYYTPDAPQISKVSAGKLVKLRFINGAAASNFWIKLGKLSGKLVAVDGQPVRPISGNKFQIAMAQRLDIIVQIPQKGGTFPILGQVEGLKAQTGLILTTEKVPSITELKAKATTDAPSLDYSQELRLHGIAKDKELSGNVNIDMGNKNKNNAVLNLVMTGDMSTYQWQLNGQSWPKVTPLTVKVGQVVTLVLDNQSMMAHPIHLHGYDFKVISIDGKKIDGANRDTVLVLPDSKVIVQFIAKYPGKWLLHCHMEYHMVAGMMTYLLVAP